MKQNTGKYNPPEPVLDDSFSLNQLLPSRRGHALDLYARGRKGLPQDELAARLGQVLGASEGITPNEFHIAALKRDKALEALLDPPVLELLRGTSKAWGVSLETVLSESISAHQHVGPSQDALFQAAEFADI